MRVPVCGTLPVPEIHLYHDDGVTREFLESKGFVDVEFHPGGGETFFLEDDEGNYYIVVVLRSKPDAPVIGDLALLAHECWHVTRAILDFIGEDEPGEETEAYILQSVYEQMCYVHLQWRDLMNSGSDIEVD